jgi:tryptophan synthase alpha chain
VRAATDLPIALGFGLSTPQHVRDACVHADAAVVGSALVQTIADAGARGDDPAQAAGALVTWLRGAET